MTRSNLLINNFNTGEVSELIESRSDLSKYAAACKTLENAVPLVEGGAKKMPGTYFAGATANGGSQFTGSITGNILTITAINYGYPQIGETLLAASVPANTTIVAFLDMAFNGFISGTTLVVVTVQGGVMRRGSVITGTGIAPGTTVVSFGTGTGGTGTYNISISQTVGTEDMRAERSSPTGVGLYYLSVNTGVSSEIMSTTSNGKSRLAAFQFSTSQGAILEFSAGIIRIWEGATQGSWSLGLALQVPAELNYDPATAYTPGDVALVGPTLVLAPNPPPTLTSGLLYISAPYGTTNASTVSVSTAINSIDTLAISTFSTSPNQGILIQLANTTPAHNAASLIQAGIRALISLNVGSGNFIDLSAWTVTPDSVYFSSPWTSLLGSDFGWSNLNSIVQAVNANSNDEFPYVATSLFPLQLQLNTAFWEIFDPASEFPIQLTTPYREQDLFALDCSTQSADVLWIFHPNYPPAVVERLSANSWSYSLALPGQQPGEPAYRGTLDVVKTGYSALGQNISLISQSGPCIVVLATSSTTVAPFTDGSRIYINLCAGLVELNEGEFLVSGITYGSVAITVKDSTGTPSTITATGWYMNLQDPSTLATIDSSSYLQYAGGGFAVQVVALFNSAGNYPACGTLYQERLCVGGSLNNPTQLNGSVQDDYPDFISDPNEEDFAFQFTLVSNQVNQLLNMIGTPNALMIGTSGGVWVVSSANGSSLSQTNVNASQQSTIGVSALQPQLVNGSAVFVSRSARIVTFMTYNFVTNQWDNTDLTRLNREITIGTSEATSGIAQTAFQIEPYPILWAVRNDGQLIALVFNTQDQVYAWFRVNMIPGGGMVESVAIISGQNQEDQVAIVVNRTINGLTRRYVEYFMPQELFHQLSNAFFVHSGQQFQGVGPFAITNITNANPAVVTAPGHTLQNGQSIAIANVLGMTQANTNPLNAWTVAGVSGDTFQLSGIDSTIWSPYTSGGTVEQVTNQLTGLSYLLGQTVVAIGDQQVIFEGPVSADTVNFGSYANQVTIGIPFDTTIQPMNPVIGNPQATSKGKKQKFTRATFSLYESVGGQYGTDSGHLYDMSYGSNSVGNPPTMFTGNITRDMDGEWDIDDTILIVHSDPFPFTLRSVTPRLSVAEEG